MATTDDQLTLVKGTLDVLVLKALTWGPMHGFEITTWLESHLDLLAVLAAAVTVASVLVSAATTLEDENVDLERFFEQLGTEADALLQD